MQPFSRGIEVWKLTPKLYLEMRLRKEISEVEKKIGRWPDRTSKNHRHYQALRQASNALEKAIDELQAGGELSPAVAANLQPWREEHQALIEAALLAGEPVPPAVIFETFPLGIPEHLSTPDTERRHRQGDPNLTDKTIGDI